MIYLDSSVALAELLAEDRRPSAALWKETLVSSRLLEYEVWVRLHAVGLGLRNARSARRLIARVSLLELDARILERALQPFPVNLRTLDALHMASALYLRDQGEDVGLATYDRRMAEAASALEIPIHA